MHGFLVLSEQMGLLREAKCVFLYTGLFIDRWRRGVGRLSMFLSKTGLSPKGLTEATFDPPPPTYHHPPPTSLPNPHPFHHPHHSHASPAVKDPSSFPLDPSEAPLLPIPHPICPNFPMSICPPRPHPLLALSSLTPNTVSPQHAPSQNAFLAGVNSIKPPLPGPREGHLGGPTGR